MSGFEMKPVDEAQFNAFLQGKDDLSRLLRELPQPKSSPSLDAAILALVTADLGQESNDPQIGAVLTSTAANEAAFDRKQPLIRLKKSFFQAWRMPLGLAASALMAVSLWHFVGKDARDVELARVEESYPQAAPSVAAPSARLDSKKGLEEASGAAKAPRAVSIEVKEDTQKPVLAKNAKTVRPEVLEKPVETELAKANSASIQKDNDQVIAYVEQAGAVSRAAPQADIAISPASENAEKRQQLNRSRELEAEAKKILLAKSKAKDEELAKLAEKDAARTAIAAPRPVAAAAPVSAAPPPVAAAMPATSPQILSNAEHLARAKAWASLVEELLKANLNQEALDEWLKFRKVYPTFQVSDRLQEKIKVLQAAGAKARGEQD